MATFTKLFPIRIVARSRFGRVSRERIRAFTEERLALSSFSSAAPMEKYAISEAEIAAEHISSRIMMQKARISPDVSANPEAIEPERITESRYEPGRGSSNLYYN